MMSKLVYCSQTSLLSLSCFLALGNTAHAVSLNFNTVVNNGDLVPDTNRFFNSYNPPSLNNNGLVVFRARSQGGTGQPATGICPHAWSPPRGRRSPADPSSASRTLAGRP